MVPTHALVFYRKNYLFGVARPGALVFDGTNLTLRDNDLAVVWTAPLSAVRVKKGTGILTVRINGDKTAILTAIGSRPSPKTSEKLRGLLESGNDIAGAPSVRSADAASYNAGVAGAAAGVATYAKGQKALRTFFSGLEVLD